MLRRIQRGQLVGGLQVIHIQLHGPLKLRLCRGQLACAEVSKPERVVCLGDANRLRLASAELGKVVRRAAVLARDLLLARFDQGVECLRSRLDPSELKCCAAAVISD